MHSVIHCSIVCDNNKGNKPKCSVGNKFNKFCWYILEINVIWRFRNERMKKHSETAMESEKLKVQNSA
jgi:hypothetical protein